MNDSLPRPDIRKWIVGRVRGRDVVALSALRPAALVRFGPRADHDRIVDSLNDEADDLYAAGRSASRSWLPATDDIVSANRLGGRMGTSNWGAPWQKPCPSHDVAKGAVKRAADRWSPAVQTQDAWQPAVALAERSRVRLRAGIAITAA